MTLNSVHQLLKLLIINYLEIHQNNHHLDITNTVSLGLSQKLAEVIQKRNTRRMVPQPVTLIFKYYAKTKLIQKRALRNASNL